MSQPFSLVWVGVLGELEIDLASQPLSARAGGPVCVGQSGSGWAYWLASVTAGQMFQTELDPAASSFLLGRRVENTASSALGSYRDLEVGAGDP